MLTSYLREQLNAKKTELEIYKKQKLELVKEKEKQQKDIESSLEARDIIILAAKETQKQLEIHFSNLVTMALRSVFNDKYSFKIAFETRRNTTEADLLLVENKREMRPLDSSGYGVCDVISLALRISYWKLQDSRNCILWDEPLRFLSSDLHDLVSKTIKEISEKLNLQFIIVTHNEALTNFADKVFYVTKRNGKSDIKTI